MQLLPSLLPTAPLSDISQVMASLNAVAGSTSTVSVGGTSTVDFDTARWYYPDVDGQSMTCLKDYRRVGNPWFHDTLEACCKQHYDKYYHLCAGSNVRAHFAFTENTLLLCLIITSFVSSSKLRQVGFYPNWSLKNGVKCSNNNETIPSFVKMAADTYQHETIEEVSTRQSSHQSFINSPLCLPHSHSPSFQRSVANIILRYVPVI